MTKGEARTIARAAGISSEPPVSRRKLLIGASGAAIAAALVKVSSAAAAPTDPVIIGPESSETNRIQPTGSAANSVVPLSVRGATGQSVELQQWQSDTGEVLASVQGDGGLVTKAALRILGRTQDGVSVRQPLVVFRSDDVSKWSLGLDSAENPPHESFFIGRVYPDQSVGDVFFLKPLGPSTAIGLNFTPPPEASVSISGLDAIPTAPALLLRRARNQTGDLLRIIASSGATIGSIAADLTLNFDRITAPSGLLTTRQSVLLISPNVSAPSGLFLNAKYSDRGPDYQLRNAQSDLYGTHFFQITNRDASRNFLSISRRTGMVGIGNIVDMTSMLDVDGDSVRVRQPKTPASNDPGKPGTIAWDSGYVYVCVANNSWKRAQLQSY
jgi:hypothetical protein